MRKLVLVAGLAMGLFASNIDIQQWDKLNDRGGLLNLTKVKNVIIQNVFTPQDLDSVKVVNANKNFTKKECNSWKEAITKGNIVLINFIGNKKTIVILLDKEICNIK